MELRHLRYVCTIAAERHLTRAAARLGIQQPPLSQALRQVEAELGTALFRRTPRGMEPTAAGLAFLPEAEAALLAAERAAEAARAAAAGMSGELRLGIVTSAALHPAVPGLIRAYARALPTVRLVISEGNAADLTERVTAGTLDAGILRLPVAPAQGWVMTEMLREPVLLALPTGHAALAGRGAREAIPLVALRDDPFILVRRAGAPGLYSALLDACRRAGFEPRVGQEVGQMLTNLNLVAIGQGVSAVPASMRGIHPTLVAYRRMADRPALEAPLSIIHRAEPAPTVQRLLALASPSLRGTTRVPM